MTSMTMKGLRWSQI